MAGRLRDSQTWGLLVGSLASQFSVYKFFLVNSLLFKRNDSENRTAKSFPLLFGSFCSWLLSGKGMFKNAAGSTTTT